MPSTPWDGVRKYFSQQTPSPSSTALVDYDRIRAYEIYENFYWNTPDTFKLVARGADDQPLYLPSTRRIIETTLRFLAVNWNYLIDPSYGTPDEQKQVSVLLRRLFAREQMYVKFITQKRYGLIRGDAFWHVVANPAKPATERISVHELDPKLVFAITNYSDPNTVLGWHLVDLVPHPTNPNVQAHRRQTYRKIGAVQQAEYGDDSPASIQSSLGIYELGKWDDRPGPTGIVPPVSLIREIQPPIVLPSPINSLPVYHVRNQRDIGIWGSSQTRGIETVIAALNQAVSDQDLTLALQGLGLYVTDSGPPLDPVTKQPTTAKIGPGTVVEVTEGAFFNRVQGVSGLPGLQHMDFLNTEMDRGIGLPAIASGKVDVVTAQSGIALFLEMAPLLAANAEKEAELLAVMDHFLYDIVTKWFVAYEQLPIAVAQNVEVASVVGDPMPKDRAADMAEIISLITAVPPLITVAMAQAKLADYGYEFPPDAANAVLAEHERIQQAQNRNPLANRANSNLDDSNVSEPPVDKTPATQAGTPPNPVPNGLPQLQKKTPVATGGAGG